MSLADTNAHAAWAAQVKHIVCVIHYLMVQFGISAWTGLQARQLGCGQTEVHFSQLGRWSFSSHESYRLEASETAALRLDQTKRSGSLVSLEFLIVSMHWVLIYVYTYIYISVHIYQYTHIYGDMLIAFANWWFFQIVKIKKETHSVSLEIICL